MTASVRCGFDDAVARLLGNGDDAANLFEVFYQTSVTYFIFISSFLVLKGFVTLLFHCCVLFGFVYFGDGLAVLWISC